MNKPLLVLNLLAIALGIVGLVLAIIAMATA